MATLHLISANLGERPAELARLRAVARPEDCLLLLGPGLYAAALLAGMPTPLRALHADIAATAYLPPGVEAISYTDLVRLVESHEHSIAWP